MKLQQKLDQMKANFENSAPPEALAVMHKATEELKNVDMMSKIVKKGDILPDFSLQDQNGNLVSFEGMLQKGVVVLSVYRGVW